jgi:hypothetical protein
MENNELELIKKFENSKLYGIEKGTMATNAAFHLSPHYDGKVNMAIGYGLDLKVNSWATISVIRSYITQIIKNNSVTVFNLMNCLAIDFKARVTTAGNETVRKTGRDIWKKHKLTLEDVIHGKEKDYRADNKGINIGECPGHRDELIEEFSATDPVKTPKCEEFFKSFLPVEQSETPKQETSATDEPRKETDAEVLARVGKGFYMSPKLSKVITIAEAYRRGLAKLDSYRKMKV